MPLEEYRARRDFEQTPEPRGRRKRSRTGRLYAIQKHAARRLHYDLRLELDGVLLSWAVPKGPSLDPGEKRLAVQTEDHPIEYGDFEGVIPDGYGAGTVMLWDTGAWTPLEDPHEGLRTGKMKFELHGQKLRGAWTLIRLKGDGNDRNWLLIKERDAEVRREAATGIVDEQPYSVATGRTIREITDAADSLWSAAQGRLKEAEAAPVFARELVLQEPLNLELHDLPGARAARQPARLKAPEPERVEAVPDDDDWLHEIRVRGRRMLVFLTLDNVRMIDGEGTDWTGRLPTVARAFSELPVRQAVFDGVLTVLDAAGVSRPDALAGALQTGRAEGLTCVLFDLPFCDGYDLRKSALRGRKDRLERLLADRPQKELRYSEHIPGNGAAVQQQADALGAPGLVSKRADSAYGARGRQVWKLVDLAPPDDAANGPDVDSAGTPATSRGSGTGSTSPPAVVTEPGQLERHGVRISNPERILYPEERVTKRMLVDYYERVADAMLPHIAHRPLSLYRCPGGLEKDCFFQKHLGEMESPYLRESPVRKEEGKDPYIVLEELRGLLTLAHLSVLEIHPWGCREDDIEKPDRMIFDLDPGPGVDWPQLVDGARLLRAKLADLGLASWVKTSGGKGLHVVVPLTRRGDWKEVKAFAGAVAREIVREDAKRFVATMAKWARERRVFIDYFRNVRGATCAAVFSTRARPGAPVSAPLHWDELDPKRPAVYTVLTLPRRLERLDADPWAGFLETRQSLTKAMKRQLKLER